MRGVMEHCDATGMEHCDDKSHGELLYQRSWGIVMSGAMRLLVTGIMELCDDKGHGALCRQGSWSIGMKHVMQHFDESDHGAL